MPNIPVKGDFANTPYLDDVGKIVVGKGPWA